MQTSGEHTDHSPGPADTASQRQIRERIEGLVAALPERYRLPVLLHYLHGLSHAEIAEILDKPTGTVSSNIHRGLKKLEPFARRAGLKGAIGALGAAAVSSRLFSPPSSLDASAVYVKAHASLATGAAALPKGKTRSSWSEGTHTSLPLKSAALVAIGAVGMVAVVLLGLTSHDANLVQQVAEPGGTAAISNRDESPASGGAATTVAPRARPRPPPEPVAEETVQAEGPLLKGVVRDRNTGQPISGATIRIVGGLYEATTDEEGAYAIAGLVRPGAPLLRFFTVGASDYALQAAQTTRSSDTDIVRNFDLEPGVEALVHVIENDGNPVAGAGLGMTFGGRHHDLDITTDDDGHATVPGISPTQPQPLYAKKEGYRALGRHHPTVAAQETRVTATMVLEPIEDEAGYYIGRITDQAGEPLPQIEVRVDYADKGNVLQREVTRTDDAGRYELLLDNPKSDYHLTAGGGTYAPVFLLPEPPGPATEPTGVDFSLEAENRLDGVVVDTNGAPLVGIQLQADGVGSNGRTFLLFGDNHRVITQDDGRFEVLGVPANGVSLIVRSGGFSYPRQRFAANDDVRIALRAAGRIDGRVVGPTGEPIQDFTVKKVEQRSSYLLSQRVGEAIHSEEGRFALTGLHPETPYIVRVEAPGYLPVVEENVSASDQESTPELVVRLQEGTPLTGQIIDAESGQPLAATSVVYGFLEDGSAFYWGYVNHPDDQRLVDLQRTTTDRDGKFAFLEGSRPGLLLVQKAGYCSTAIEPENRGTHTVDGQLVIPLKKGASLSGTLRRAGRPMSGTRISSWDGFAGHGPVNVNADGSFFLGGLPGGVHEIKVIGFPDGFTHEVALAPGERKVLHLGEQLGSASLSGRAEAADGRRSPRETSRYARASSGTS